MKLHNIITFDDLEEIWVTDDDGTPTGTEIVLPDTESEEQYYVEL